MTEIDETSFDESAIWINRTDVLLEIAKDIAKKLEFPEKDFRDAWIKGLKDSPEQEFVAIWLWYLSPYPYEIRQREICRCLLNLLIEFITQAASLLSPSDPHNEGDWPKHLWRVLLNEASTDLQIIQAAVQQRLPKRNEENPFDADSSMTTVFLADIISEHAMSQAIEAGFLKQTPVITYLKKDVSIRSVPYAEVVLISVAYASMQPGFGKRNKEGTSYIKVSSDFLAIPHEVGHHLFWHGYMPGKKRSVGEYLQKRLKRAKIREWDWRRGWLEEIFADAYGFLVAGPVMAHSFQEMLTDNLPANFREDTGHHPIPALRPYIQTRILCRITDDHGFPLYRVAPTLLDEKWSNLSKWDGADPLQVEFKLHGVAQPMTGQQILEALDEIINIVLRTLRGQRPPHAGANWTHGGWKAWTTDMQKGDKDLCGLYNNLTYGEFPAESRWFQSLDFTGQANIPQDWGPEQIRSAWSVEGPEDSRG